MVSSGAGEGCCISEYRQRSQIVSSRKGKAMGGPHPARVPIGWTGNQRLMEGTCSPFTSGEMRRKTFVFKVLCDSFFFLAFFTNLLRSYFSLLFIFRDHLLILSFLF